MSNKQHKAGANLQTTIASQRHRGQGRSKSAGVHSGGAGPSSTQRPKPWMWALLAGLVVVALLGVVAIVSTGDDEGGAGSETTEIGVVNVDGDALPSQPEGAGLADPKSDEAVGKVAPKLSGRTFGGSKASIDFAKPTLVMFVAHWCAHCRAEVPKVVQWAKAGAVPDTVRVVAVSTGVDANKPNYPPSAWLAKEKWPFEALKDSEFKDASKAYGLGSFPYFVAVGADGKVVQRASGELTEAQFTELISATAQAAGK